MIKILHIDDENAVHLLTKSYLLEQDKNLDISWVESGEEAIELIKKNSFDCLLCDYQMSKMTGIALLTRLRANGNLTPFIFLTAQGNEQIAVEAFQLGASDYFTKEAGFAHYERMLNSIKTHVIRCKELAEKEKIKKALDKNDSLHRLIIEQSPCVIELYAADGLQIEVNKAYEDLWGFPASTTLNKFNVLKNKDVEGRGLMSYVKRAYAGETVAILEYKFDPAKTTEPKGKGSVKWLNTRIYPLKNANGTVKNIVITHEDITTLRKTLFASNIVENMSEAVTLVKESNGIIVYTNPKFNEIFGYESGEIIGKHVSILNSPSEKTPHEKTLEILKSIAESGTWKGEILNITKDGTPFWNYATVVPFDHPEFGRTFISVNADITKRKMLEKGREQLISDFELKNEELQDIVYASAHDLRPSVININAFVDLLTNDLNKLHEIYSGKIPKDLQHETDQLMKRSIPQKINLIQSSTMEIENLLNGLLRVSNTGIKKHTIETLDMDKLIQEIIRVMNFQIKQNNVTVTFEKLPDCQGDRLQISQVFTNLIDNAIKYKSPKHKCSIHISGATQNEMSVYCIKDNGIGIDKSFQHKIFTIFHRLDSKNPVKGEGLGLSIVKRILDQNKGIIEVESDTDSGSKFFVSLSRKVHKTES